MSDINKQKERLIELRTQLRQAMEFENKHETWSDIVTKLLNAAHQISIKATNEVNRLQSQLDKALGTQETADILSDIIVNTLSAHNRQEEARKASEALKEAGLDGPSAGDLEVQQREKEAEEIAKREKTVESDKSVISTSISKPKAPVKRRRSADSSNTIRRKRK